MTANDGTGAAIVWFRKDLRLFDNPALAQASESELPVVPVFILDDDTHRDNDWAVGAASRWWLDASLRQLQASLSEKGLSLVLRRGKALDCLEQLIAQTGATQLYWNRCYEGDDIARDKQIKQRLGDAGIDVFSYNGALLNEPWEIETGSGKPYQVFTPYWKSVLRRGVSRLPLALPDSFVAHGDSIDSESLDDWQLTPVKPDWSGGLRERWRPGEAGAWQQLQTFLESGVDDYAEARDHPSQSGTSFLSPHLHFGEISPLAIWHETQRRIEDKEVDQQQAMAFLREIGWREFCYNLLFYHPALPDRNLKPAFDALPWLEDADGLRAWQKGRTGFPIVDAGMRQLWHTGWMHNRVRMIAASFLIKDLMVHWREGERWFWDTLVDADLANNAAGWQWVAGSGADAAPYFRVFNPTTQGKKFDPEGAYVRRWIPELAALPDRYIHEPAAAPAQVLADAGIVLGEHYPQPLVDHKFARQRALDGYEKVRKHQG